MGQSNSADTTIHYDPRIIDSYAVLVDWGLNHVLPDTIGLKPYGFGMSDVNNAFMDFHANFFAVFMQNFDIEALNDSLQARMIDSAVVDNEVNAHNQYLEDDINQNVLPKIKAGLRDIGAVMTSSFLDSQAMVEMNKQKAVTKYKADLKLEMIKLSQDRWKVHLTWNQKIVEMYLEELRNYYPAADTYFKTGNDVQAKNALWPWTVLDNMRAIIGCLNGAQAGHSTTATPSGMQQAGTYVGMAAGLATLTASLFGNSQAATLALLASGV